MKLDGPFIDSHAMIGEEHHLSLTPEELLRRMDAAGVETAVAHPVGAELAVDNAEGNSRVLRAHRRIKGLAVANPWYGERARAELRRCRDLGAVGLYLHPSRQGFWPTEPSSLSLVALAADFGWPVMFHTGTFIYSDLLAVAEVARKFPRVAFIAGFGGYTDMWFELPGVFRETPNLVLDAALLWAEAVEEIVRLCGAERVLFASAEPRNRYASVLRSLSRLDLDDSQSRALLFGNARRIFRL